MTPGPRGWIVVAIFTVVAVSLGWTAGRAERDSRWRADWTQMQSSAVGMLCKGDKL